MRTAPPNYRNTQGFSMMEVLISLVVLSIGLLGLAGLQTLGLKFNQQSYQRSQAVVLAYDIIDRIRANPVGKANYYVAANATPANPGAGKCTTTACTPAELAAYDIIAWKNAIASTLANGTGAITATAGAPRAITITWKESELIKGFTVEVEL